MQLADILELAVKKMPVNFTLKGSKMSYTDMFSDTGLLPGFAKRADNLASLCLGYGLGIKIDDEEKSLLGVRVSFDEFTPDVIRIFCILDVIQEIVKMSLTSSDVSLDELLYD